MVPFPTIHWLVSPRYNRMCSILEDKYGGVSFFTKLFSEDEVLGKSLMASHGACYDRTVELLKMGNESKETLRKKWFSRSRGVGGGRVENGGIRCLHMHLAFYLGTGNHELGRMVEEWGKWLEEGKGEEWMRQHSAGEGRLGGLREKQKGKAAAGGGVNEKGNEEKGKESEPNKETIVETAGN